MTEKKLSPLDAYWQKFLAETGREADEVCSGDLNFESKGISNDSRVALVLCGRKTAMFSSFASFSADGEPLPVSGELYLVLDRGGIPRCVIELDGVEIVPFCEVTWDMAVLEGEDGCLEEWKNRQQENLEDEGAVVGFGFNPAMRLVFQKFRVVYR